MRNLQTKIFFFSTLFYLSFSLHAQQDNQNIANSGDGNVAVKKNGFLSSLVVDQSGMPLIVQIDITDNSTNTIVQQFESSRIGYSRISLPSGSYNIVFSKPGFLFHSENFVLPDSAGFEKKLKKIILKKIEIGNNTQLNNISFEENESVLKQGSFSDLERVIALMNEIVSLQIEISGTVDEDLPSKTKSELAKQRAEVLINYLVSKGIDKNRLIFKGGNSEKPIELVDLDNSAINENSKNISLTVLKVESKEEVAQAPSGAETMYGVPENAAKKKTFGKKNKAKTETIEEKTDTSATDSIAQQTTSNEKKDTLITQNNEPTEEVVKQDNRETEAIPLPTEASKDETNTEPKVLVNKSDTKEEATPTTTEELLASPTEIIKEEAKVIVEESKNIVKEEGKSITESSAILEERKEEEKEPLITIENERIEESTNVLNEILNAPNPKPTDSVKKDTAAIVSEPIDTSTQTPKVESEAITEKSTEIAKVESEPVTEKSTEIAKVESEPIVEKSTEIAKEESEPITEKSTEIAKEESEPIAEKSTEIAKEESEPIAEKSTEIAKVESEPVAEKSTEIAKEESEPIVEKSTEIAKVESEPVVEEVIEERTTAEKNTTKPTEVTHNESIKNSSEAVTEEVKDVPNSVVGVSATVEESAIKTDEKESARTAPSELTEETRASTQETKNTTEQPEKENSTISEVPKPLVEDSKSTILLERFIKYDTGKDGIISYKEIMNAIDTFFDDDSLTNAREISELIEYFFDNQN